jgi:hypothetical protein
LFHFVLTHKSSLTCLSEIKSHVQLTKAIKWAITKKVTIGLLYKDSDTGNGTMHLHVIQK